jgi:lysophospholipid acyltransferase (LPLAT)-like uncharacterized protein
MSLVKKIIKSSLAKKALCKLVFYYIKFVLFTSRVNITFKDFNFNEYKDKQCILATWHGRVLIMPMINPFILPASAIVSDHNDGRLIGDVIKQSGIELIFGSSNRRRLSSLKEIISFIKKGYNFLITPDGPRGPARQINGAIINIASSSKLPIIPATCSSKNAKIFKSWDKFMLPYPFNRIEIIFDKPIYIPHDIAISERETYSKILENSLNNITDLADKKLKQDV